MRRHQNWMCITATVALGAGAACPRPVYQAGNESNPVVPVVVESLTMEPSRAELVATSLEVPGFAGDMLVISGKGWDAQVAQLRVGGVVLTPSPRSTDTELRAELPLGMDSGPVIVISGERSSAPSAQQVRFLGQGHMPTPRDQGVVEPSITILGAGTSGTHCRELPLASGGVTDCALYSASAGMVSLAFGFGASVGPRESIFITQVLTDSNTSFTTELPFPPGQTQHWVNKVIPYLQITEDGAFTPTWWETLVTQSTAGESSPPRPNVDTGVFSGNQAVDLESPAQVFRLGLVDWVAISTATAPHQVGYLSRDGGIAEGLGLQGRATAAALMEPGWDPTHDREQQPTLVDLSVRGVPPQEQDWLVHRVYLPNPALGRMEDANLSASTTPLIIPNPPDCLPPAGGCNAWGADNGPEACGLFCAQRQCQMTGNCQDQLRAVPLQSAQRVMTCQKDPDCLERIMAALRCFGDPSCAARFSCPDTINCSCQGPDAADGGTGPNCRDVLDCWNRTFCNTMLQSLSENAPLGAGPHCLATNTCATQPGLEAYPAAVECTLDPQCSADVWCDDHESLCRMERACRAYLARASTGGNILEITPFAPGHALVVPRAVENPLETPSNPVCLLNLNDNRMEGVEAVDDLQVVTLAVFPDADFTRSRLALLPVIQEPLEQVWTYSFVSGFTRMSTRTHYLWLLADPVYPNLYAVPAHGARMDVLDLEGREVDRVSVLGPPWDAWPTGSAAADGQLLVAYPHALLRMSLSGMKEQFSLAEIPVPPALERNDLGDPTAVWSTEIRITNTYEVVGVRRYSVAAGDFGVVTHQVDWTAGGVIYPVAVDSWRVLVQQFPMDGSVEGNVVKLAYVGRPDRPGGAGTVEGWDTTLFQDHDPLLNRVYFLAIDQSLVETNPEAAYQTGVLDLSGEQVKVMSPPELLPAAVSLVAVPQRGAIGLFYRPAEQRFKLGGITVDLTFYELGESPFAEAVWAVSPDGRRLYAGVDDAVVEMALETRVENPKQLAVSVATQVPVAAKPNALHLDPGGNRLVYVNRSQQLLGVVK